MTADAATRFGRYDLLAHLATGGMAEIFLARAEGAAGFAKLVVVKRLLESLAGEPEYVEMFLDEARIAARLSHTNVVQCLDLGEVDGRYFMAMEYVAGLSVAQVGKLATRRLGKVPQEIAAGIVVQAAAGLHSAHEQRAPDGTPLGIVHRDVSPQNLLLTNEGIVKLVDFGIAKAAGRATNTRAGVIKGKFGYLSPEQCVGEAIDRRSDVFALGIVLFELCTSRRLFKRGSTLHTYEAIASCQVPDPRSLNPAIAPPVAAVIKRALAKGAGERFQTAEEFGGALEEAMRRSALDGTSTALATFLERHFAPELEQQRALVEQADRGALRGRKKVAQEDAAPEMEAVDDPADNEPTTAWAGEATAIDADDHAETVMDDAPPGFGEGEATSLDEDLPDDEHTVEGGPFALPPPRARFRAAPDDAAPHPRGAAGSTADGGACDPANPRRRHAPVADYCNASRRRCGAANARPADARLGYGRGGDPRGGDRRAGHALGARASAAAAPRRRRARRGGGPLADRGAALPAHGVAESSTGAPPCWSDRCAAASTRTTASPSEAPLRGVAPEAMHDTKCPHSSASGSAPSMRGMWMSPWRMERYCAKSENSGGRS